MKPALFPVLFICVATLGLPAWSARALDPSLFNDGFAPLTPGVTQFFLDLEAIPAGSVVTDAQHQTLVADLAALPPGGEAPGADDLDKLATDFGSLAVAGLVDDDLEYNLAMDFDVDYPDPDPWLPYVWNDVLFTLNPPPPYDPNNPGDGGDVDPVIYETAVPTAVRLPRPNKFVTRVVASLLPTYYQEPGQASIAYSGTARLSNLSVNGLLPVPILRISTFGLPLGQSYTVNAVRKSDGASVALGKFRPHGTGQMTAPVLLPPGADPALSVTQLLTASAVSFGGQAKRRLPDGFNINDVASVTVSDAQGRVVLDRDFSADDTSSANVRRVRLPLEAKSTAVPRAKGTALSVSRLRTGEAVSRNSFLFVGRHLPPGVPVTLNINGTAAGQYITTADGHLMISQKPDPKWSLLSSGRSVNITPLAVPGDWSNLKSVSVTDARGNVLLSGSL